MQLNLPRIDPKRVNIELLKLQPKGTVALFIDLDGKLKAVDQSENPVDIIPAPNAAQAASPEAEEAIISQVADKINEGLNKALEDQKKAIEEQHKKELEEVSSAFTQQLKQVQDALKKLQPKPKPKPKPKAK